MSARSVLRLLFIAHYSTATTQNAIHLSQGNVLVRVAKHIQRHVMLGEANELTGVVCANLVTILQWPRDLQGLPGCCGVELRSKRW